MNPALTPAQQATLATSIAADPILGQLPHNSDSADAVRIAYNLLAVPDFWVWRSHVPVKEMYERTMPAPDNTSWSWTAYIGRSAAERDAWREMTAPGAINTALTATRAGIADIFSGAPGAAQRAHLTTLGRRKASRVEKLFAQGTGSTASPATMDSEGPLTGNEVLRAWGL